MKVLFAVDGSSGSLDAISQVAPLLAPGKAEAALYCSPPDAPGSLAAASPDVLVRARQGLVDAIFDEARRRLPDACRAAARTIVDEHDARHGIVTAANEWGADLVVVGARGLGTFERLLLGSVSRAVVHASKIPVWVARTVADRELRQGVKVLLACEKPELGLRSAEVLSGFAWPEGSTGRTLTVVPSMFAGKVPDWLQQQARSPEVEEMVQAWAREHDAELRQMRSLMEQFSARLPAGLRRLEPIVAEGEPTGAILSATAREKIDLVVVGAYRKNWLASALLGSTTTTVIDHAGCAVLVVPHVDGS